MKKFLSMLLAVAMVATLAIGASALGDAGLYTYDESDGEYWSPALTMFDKTVQGIWFEDGTVAGHNIAQLADGTFLEENAMANLKSGWYEVVLCNLGTNPEWFPAEVEGKLALCVRGDSTFTVKSENALNAGAIGMLMGNNCRAVELVDENGVMTGEYENITMNLDYATLPMGSVSSDVTARLVAACAGIPIAEAVTAVEDVYFGDLELSVSHKQGAWVFIGTEAEFKANTTRTDANTITGAGAAAATTEAPAAEAATETADLQNLCLGATVTEVSGLETEGSNTGEMAIDGDITTRWSSNTDDNAHIIIDIGSSPLPIGYVEIHWETACAQDYTIETSSDGTSWDVKATVTGNTAGTSPWSEDCVVVHEWEPATARFIKINCTKRNTEWGNSIWEIVARKAADTVENTAPAAYPASGTEIPAGSVLINGERIGLAEGWGGNAAAGRDAAFDGDVTTFFDPLGTGDGWAGIDAGEEMILTKIVIHPRDGWAARFDGATIEASNDPEFEDSVELYFNANGAAEEVTFIDVTSEMEESENTGYRYFRYINYMQHGDVAEVELYGKAVDGSNPTYGAAAVEEAPAPVVEETPAVEEPVVEEPAVEEPVAEEPAVEETVEEEVVEETVVEEAVVEETVEETVEEEAAQTFDFGVIAVVAALVSAAGYALSKKR